MDEKQPAAAPVFDRTAYKNEGQPWTPSEVTPPQEAAKQEKDPRAPFGFESDGVTPRAPFGWKVDKHTGERRPRRATGPGGAASLRPDDGARLQEELKQAAPAPTPVGGISTSPGQQAPGTPGGPAKPAFEVHISGALFLMALDIVLPGVIATVYNMVAPNTVNSNDLRLDAEDRKELEGAANVAVKELLASMNPLQQFIMFTSFMYIGKLMTAEKTPKKKKVKEAPPAPAEDVITGPKKQPNKKTK